jgi:NTE family protein
MDIGTFILFSNLSRHQAEIFSAETTPDMAVANAARMSMSISLFFESLRLNGHQFDDGDYYVDGGLYNNYPVHIFDQQRYVHHGRFFSNGINWETLGLFLYPDQIQNIKMHENPENLWEYIDLTVRSIYDSHQTASLDHNPVDGSRTVCISDCGISALKFEITKGSGVYGCLYQSGYNAVIDFLTAQKSRR